MPCSETHLGEPRTETMPFETYEDQIKESLIKYLFADRCQIDVEKFLREVAQVVLENFMNILKIPTS